MKLILLHGLPGLGKITSVDEFRKLRKNRDLETPAWPKSLLILDNTCLAPAETAGLIHPEAGCRRPRTGHHEVRLVQR